MTGQHGPVTVEVLPGTSTFHVTDGLLALVTEPAAHAPGGFFDILCEQRSAHDALLRVLAMPLELVPSFGIAFWSGGSVHIVVRGNVHAQVFARGAEPFQIDGTDLVTWCEQRYDGIEAVALTSEPPTTPAEPTITTGPRGEGSWVRCATGSRPVPRIGLAQPPVAATNESTGEDQPAPPTAIEQPVPEPSLPAEQQQPPAAQPSAPAATPPESIPPVPAMQGIPPEPSNPAEMPVPPAPPVPQSIPEASPPPEPATHHEATVAAQAVWPPPPPQAGSELEREMLDLLGATTTAEALRDLTAPPVEVTAPHPGPLTEPVAPHALESAVGGGETDGDGSVPPAPTRQFQDDALASPPPVRPVHAPVPQPSARPAIPGRSVGPAGDSGELAPPAGPAGLIHGVPGMAPSPPAAPTGLPAPPASQFGLPPLAPPATAPQTPPAAFDFTAPPSAGPAVPTGAQGHAPFRPPGPPPVAPTHQVPTVSAVRCASGHPNAPHASHCRTCGVPISDRTVGTVSRPAMGWLHFTDNTRVQITQPLLLGRNPSGVTHTPDGEPLTNMALPDPDQVLSRTHCEIRILDWQVQVIDRDSRNGTFVTIPGRPAFRLHPGDPYPLPAGASITLGESIGFSYSTADS